MRTVDWTDDGHELDVRGLLPGTYEVRLQRRLAAKDRRPSRAIDVLARQVIEVGDAAMHAVTLTLP